MQFIIQLDWNMRATPHHRMLRIRSLMTIIITNHTTLRFSSVPHHIMVMSYPLFLTLKQDSQHRCNCGVLYISFLTWKNRIIQVEKWHYRSGFNNSWPWGNHNKRLHISPTFKVSRSNLFVHLINQIHHQWNGKRCLPLPQFTEWFYMFL